MPENKHAGEFDDLIKGYKELKLRMIQQAAITALNWFKASFVNQGFTDHGLVKWKSRLGSPQNNKGRALLMGTGAGAGTLKRGLRIKQTSLNGAIVGMDEAIPYAEIHNVGGTIPITPQMRRFFWAMYYQMGGGAVGGTSERAQAANETAQFYKNMALTKDEFITIPARQFIGDSALLEQEIKQYFTSELDKFFKIDQ